MLLSKGFEYCGMSILSVFRLAQVFIHTRIFEAGVNSAPMADQRQAPSGNDPGRPWINPTVSAHVVSEQHDG